MKKEIKICMSPYKIVYSGLFLLLFSLAMGVAVIPEIGRTIIWDIWGRILTCVCILCGDKGDGSKWSAVGDLSPQAPVRQDLHDLQKMVDSGLVFICSLSGMVFCLFLAESISHQGAST